MIKKIPVSASPIPLASVLSSTWKVRSELRPGEELKTYFMNETENKHAFLFNSGLASFFAILKAMRSASVRREVVLPAYTAGSLVVAVRKAGLTPVLCDISMEDFNMDPARLERVVSKKTLCITGVHLFGIVAEWIAGIKGRFPGVYVIEDCAQAFGSEASGRPVGCMADVAFFSFNKGKNLPTYGGGCVVTNNEDIAGRIASGAKTLSGGSALENIGSSVKIMALSAAMNPYIYGPLYGLIYHFKELAPPKDFKPKKYTGYKAALALSLIENAGEWAMKRYENGTKIIEGLEGIGGVTVPKISGGTQPAFNRLPVTFIDGAKRARAEKIMRWRGIETSRMYLKPLHHMFNLGYSKAALPNAVRFSETMLALPCHPRVNDRAIEIMISSIRKALK